MSVTSDRVVLVLGGAGTVGSGIVKALLDKGFQVAVISRDESRLEKLKQFLPPSAGSRLHTLVGDVGSEDGAEAAKGDLLKRTGKVTDVVSSLGFSWWQGGPPHTQSLQELHRVLDTLLLSTFTAWKAFFPLVKDNPNGSYTFITGGAGERLLMPGTGFLTLGAAGALAFALMVRQEYPEVPCKLNEVSAGREGGRLGAVSRQSGGAQGTFPVAAGREASPEKRGAVRGAGRRGRSLLGNLRFRRQVQASFQLRKSPSEPQAPHGRVLRGAQGAGC
uniref:Uncharacterized protein n=1 Tax=Salvator merianae TaxID=96440 RepID=A0A8D0BJF7_SALMN